MKKFNLFKSLMILLLIIILFSWLVPAADLSGAGAEAARNYLGIWQVFSYLNVVMSYFGYLAIFVLAIGMFYGILNKTNAYKNVVNGLAKKFSGNSKLFIIILMCVLALITSVVGVNVQLFIFIPLLVSVILLLGYDKITALSVTVGSILMGSLASTVSYYLIMPINQNLNLNLYNNVIIKIVVLVAGMILLIMHTIKYADKKKTNTADIEEIEELANKTSDKKCLGLSIVLIILAVLVLIGVFPWTEILKINIFSDFNSWLMKFNVNNFTLIKNVVGTTPALGSWYINELSISLIMMSIVVAIIYKVKFDDMLDSFYDGIKKYLPVALIALLANLILVAVTYHAFFPTIVEWAMNLTKSFNIITTSLVAFVGGIINVDIGYLATMTLPTITGIISDTSVYPIISVIYQFMYGLAMFVAPTSLILIMTLTYLKIPYNKWLSYIWKFILQLLVILLVAIVVVTIV